MNTFLSKSKKWSISNHLKGPQAFIRYVMFRYVENLNAVSDDFILKGGNLLWVYIHTPRTTVDLDFVTLKNNSDKTVREILEEAGLHSTDINFTVKSFKSVSQNGKFGAAVVLEYKTDSGAKNKFDLDVVYGVATETIRIKSPLDVNQDILSASIENIIVDKVSACARYGSGNTRMKDYDDLWRLSHHSSLINHAKLKSVFSKRKIENSLHLEWIDDDLIKAWKNHRKNYLDLPENLEEVFVTVNLLFERGSKK